MNDWLQKRDKTGDVRHNCFKESHLELTEKVFGGKLQKRTWLYFVEEELVLYDLVIVVCQNTGLFFITALNIFLY